MNFDSGHTRNSRQIASIPERALESLQHCCRPCSWREYPVIFDYRLIKTSGLAGAGESRKLPHFQELV